MYPLGKSLLACGDDEQPINLRFDTEQSGFAVFPPVSGNKYFQNT